MLGIPSLEKTEKSLDVWNWIWQQWRTGYNKKDLYKWKVLWTKFDNDHIISLLKEKTSLYKFHWLKKRDYMVHFLHLRGPWPYWRHCLIVIWEWWYVRKDTKTQLLFNPTRTAMECKLGKKNKIKWNTFWKPLNHYINYTRFNACSSPIVSFAGMFFGKAWGIRWDSGHRSKYCEHCLHKLP